MEAITPALLERLGIVVKHHFAGKAYIKETYVPAGVALGQHVHSHDHLSTLVSGTVRLTEGDTVRELSGYQTLTLKAGIAHQIEAVTDAVWLCVWGTDYDDPDTIDDHILKGA